MITVELAEMGNKPAASGGFANIWHGIYQQERVAIRTLKIYRDDDQDMFEKVNLKLLTGFLTV